MYKQKYIKYKTKYLALKQSGGIMLDHLKVDDKVTVKYIHESGFEISSDGTIISIDIENKNDQPSTIEYNVTLSDGSNKKLKFYNEQNAPDDINEMVGTFSDIDRYITQKN